MNQKEQIEALNFVKNDLLDISESPNTSDLCRMYANRSIARINDLISAPTAPHPEASDREIAERIIRKARARNGKSVQEVIKELATIRADERRKAVETIRARAYEGKSLTNYGADQYNDALGDAETAILDETPIYPLSKEPL
jgi:hypothetical protein